MPYPLSYPDWIVFGSRRITDPATHPTRDQLRLEGFELIDERLRYLIGCLEDALVSRSLVSGVSPGTDPGE